MRCHAAEPGAVTSAIGLHKPDRGLAYREVRRRSARAAARARKRGSTGRTEGRAEIPARIRVRGVPSPVRKNGPVRPKHRGGAPVGEAARSQGPQAHPRTVSMLKVRHSALRSLSPMERRRKRHEGAPRHRGNGVAELWRKNPRPNSRLSSRPSAAQRRASRDPCIPVSPSGFMDPGSRELRSLGRDDNLNVGEVKKDEVAV